MDACRNQDSYRPGYDTDEMFTFTVKDQDNNTVSTGSVTGAAEGTAKEITFTPVNYTLEDAGNTYTYTISEDTANAPLGVKMTDKTYEVQGEDQR